MIRIYNQDAFHALQSHARDQASPDVTEKDESTNLATHHPSQASSSTSQQPSVMTSEERHKIHYEKYEKEQKALEKKMKHITMSNIAEAQARRDARFLKLCAELEKGDAVNTTLQASLDLHELKTSRRQQKLHMEWQEQVFDKIQQPLGAAMDNMQASDLTTRRCASYQKFLDQTNKKGALFRDIIIEEEYSPLTDNVALVSHVRALRDPCRRSIQRYQEEERIAEGGKKKARAKSSRHSRSGETTDEPEAGLGRNDNLDVKLWSTGIIESTPHGYTNKLLSMDHKSEGDPNFHQKYKSKVIMDHYRIPTGEKILKSEIPKGKRTSFDFPIHGQNSQIELRDS